MTIREVFLQLPHAQAEAAMDNIIRKHGEAFLDTESETELVSKAIDKYIDWQALRHGTEFWARLHVWAEDVLEETPPPKVSPPFDPNAEYGQVVDERGYWAWRRIDTP